MLRKISKFARLERRDQGLFIEAYARLALTRAAIGALPFKRLVRNLEHRQHAVAPPLDSVQMELALAIGGAVRSAAGNTPWESACLVQALSAQRMLEKRGIGGVFHLGAAMDKAANEKLRAHAWLVCGDRVITGEAGHEYYAVLSTFRWKGQLERP
jgi:hypothetical protein